MTRQPEVWIKALRALVALQKRQQRAIVHLRGRLDLPVLYFVSVPSSLDRPPLTGEAMLDAFARGVWCRFGIKVKP